MDVVWICLKTIFWHTSLMHCQQSMMGFTSLPPHLQLKSCCGRHCSPATPLPLFNTPATPLPSRPQPCHSSTPQQRHSKPVMVSLSVVFNSPPIPFFSHWSLFQLNCYSVHCAACFPSVEMANKSPPLPSHACKLHGEGGDGEFYSPFIPPSFQTCSHSFFFQSN